MEKKKAQIIYKKVENLIPYVNNPRNNDEAVDAVASSIKNFGFRSPIVIDGQGEIINGHTRLKAAKKLGLKEVPVLVADDLTPEQVKAFRLADNRVGEIATWNDDLLSIELEELDNLGFDMSDFGFDEIENDIGLDEIFFDDEEQKIKDSTEFLHWESSKTPITDDSIELLDNKLAQYNNAETNEDFVQWLLNNKGVDTDEANAS